MIEQPRYSIVSTLILAVFCGMLLSGCSDWGDFLADILRINNNDAEAQDEGRSRIEIFDISPGSFILTSDVEPDIDVQDGFTRYTLNDDGTLDLGSRNVPLELDDRVIERPASNTVTVIRRE